VIGLFVMRYREIFFGMLNLALSMVFYSLLEKLYTLTQGTDGIRLAGAAPSWAGAGAHPTNGRCSGLALVAGGGLRGRRAHLPRRAAGAGAGGHQDAGSPAGIHGRAGRFVLLAAYVLSALMAACGGTIVALTSRHVTPALAYWTASGELVFIAILGGAGSGAGRLPGRRGL
jgi:branched-chain amino acid transport system permease protein